MKAYFTVEATCILPLVLGIYVFLIYGMFYRYDRCLLEQDAALMVMRESEVLAERGTDRYLAFCWKERELNQGIGTATAKVAGSVAVPFGNMRKWADSNGWELEVTFKRWEIEPTSWIRLYEKVKKGLEDDSE